ncbi:hypothetical protein KOR42_48640 [Thalassoglobus neptunius]|uniref:Uncharacterized protein n=1 Tax=Thalassoglobus neptunius TaxID=1938619 RepID=A0A5C5VQE4_9PLAN|nr:hypothetical protein [Thalassoglobus neptunius]TWT40868.1 hypothetical protein KOR42_48640 [Thalassoglobus neptunius]
MTSKLHAIERITPSGFDPHLERVERFDDQGQMIAPVSFRQCAAAPQPVVTTRPVSFFPSLVSAVTVASFGLGLTLGLLW